MQEALLEVTSFRDGRLFGYVFGHPNLNGHCSDGTMIRTSLVKEIDFKKMIAITEHTIYKLEVAGD